MLGLRPLASAPLASLLTAAAAGVLLAPISDITVASWTSTLGGALYAAIDETVADDSDYIYSPDNPTTQACEVKFASGTDPSSSSGHIVRYRLKATGLDTTFTISLMQGATQIAQWIQVVTHDVAEATYTSTLSGAEADAITDYTDLRLRVLAAA